MIERGVSGKKNTDRLFKEKKTFMKDANTGSYQVVHWGDPCVSYVARCSSNIIENINFST